MEEHVLEQIPAYALGSLDEGEAEAVRKHLDSCAECKAELGAYASLVDRLGFAAPLVDPPADLKRKVIARVSSVRPVARRSWLERLAGRTIRPLPFSWGIVGLLLIVGLAISNLALWQQMTNLRATTEALAFRFVPLASTDVTPGADGVLIINGRGTHGTLVVDNLPELDEAHQYQLWLIKDGERTSGGVFSVSKDGYGAMWVRSPLPLGVYTSFGITIEPEGGSPSPTGDKVLGGDV